MNYLNIILKFDTKLPSCKQNSINQIPKTLRPSVLFL